MVSEKALRVPRRLYGLPRCSACFLVDRPYMATMKCCPLGGFPCLMESLTGPYVPYKAYPQGRHYGFLGGPGGSKEALAPLRREEGGPGAPRRHGGLLGGTGDS